MKKTTEKKVLGIFVAIVLGLTSCTEKQLTQDDIIKKNAEAYVKEKMNDPSSYEFVKLELIDTVLFIDNIEYRKNYFNSEIKNDSLMFQTLKPVAFSEGLKKEIENYKVKIEKNKVILLKIDSLVAELGERKNDVASYTYIFSFRGNNTFGAKILNEYILQTDPAPNFKIINMTDDKDKIYFNPNDFPGYREMIKKNQ